MTDTSRSCRSFAALTLLVMVMTAFAALVGPAPVIPMGSGERASANFGPPQLATDSANATTQFVARQQNAAQSSNGLARSGGNAADPDQYDETGQGMIASAATSFAAPRGGYGTPAGARAGAPHSCALAQPRAPPISRG